MPAKELQKMKTECREELERELVKKNEQELQEQKQRKKQYEKERKQLENDFQKQYNELVEFTKQLQVEGKHWREMYYRSTQNKAGNT